MGLDTLRSRERHVALFERYGSLLTDHQREILDLYLGRDWSLAEVAQARETSRAAVHDLVRRAAQSMEEYETRLGLLAERAAMARELGEVRRRLVRLETRLGVSA
jgi:predicted DNA-binding protein YlxM (UPF0122 family)